MLQGEAYSSRGLSVARAADSGETGGGERALSDERLRRPGRRLSRVGGCRGSDPSWHGDVSDQRRP